MSKALFTRLIAAPLSALLATCMMQAQQTTAQPGQKVSGSASEATSEPTLADTFDFMNRTLEADSSASMKSLGSCEVSLVRARIEYVMVVSGTKKIPGNYQTGVPDHYEYLWNVYDTTHLRTDFNLKDIDPNSIVANEVYSPKIIADRPDHTDAHLPPYDRSTVSFGTANMAKTVHQMDFVDVKATMFNGASGGEVAFLLEPGSTKRLQQDKIGDFVVFESNNRAVRFVKAFKHAVELCGGKPSIF
jgi:hypothetical protein